MDLPPVPYANLPEAQAMPDAPGAQVDPPEAVVDRFSDAGRDARRWHRPTFSGCPLPLVHGRGKGLTH